MARLRFDQVNIVVPDVDGAVRFLRALGAEIPEADEQWAEWAPHHVTMPADPSAFDVDVDSASFASYWGGLPDDFAGVVVNLRADDRGAVDAAVEVASTIGATVLRAPYDAFWGARYAVVRGPGPIVVGIMSPSDQEARTAGPAVSDFA